MNADEVGNLLGIIGNQLSKVRELGGDMCVAVIERLQHALVTGKLEAAQRRLLVDDPPFEFGNLSADQVTVVKPELGLPGVRYLPEQYACQGNQCKEWYEKGLF